MNRHDGQAAEPAFRDLAGAAPMKYPAKPEPMSKAAFRGFDCDMSGFNLPAPPGLRYRIFLFLYACTLRSLEFLVWRHFRKRAIGDARYGQHLDERKGESSRFVNDLWLHAVSLGEVTAAEPLIRLALQGGHRVLTTHAAPAGRARAEQSFADEISSGQMAVRYAPIDRPGYWRRFLANCNPKLGLVVEMEFWPWMIETAREAGVPLALVNSQVPASTWSKARRMARLFGHPATRAATVFTKSETQAGRFRALGAPNVCIAGETRFDMKPPDAQIHAGEALRACLGERPVLTIASVVEGEEELYLHALGELLADHEPPFVIWVPRAPERFMATAERLRAAGCEVMLRSRDFDSDLTLLSSPERAQILVGDSLGEMNFYLAPADAVIVGGGFGPRGAHNVIEPLALGKPVVTGSNLGTIEFPAIEAVEAGILTACEVPEALPDAVRAALALGPSESIRSFHASHKGASRRIYDAIQPLLSGQH